MKITLIRHFKVQYRWSSFYNSRQYEAARQGYDTADVMVTTLAKVPSGKLITSTMARAMVTSKHIFKREADQCDENLCEVPIRPFVDTKIKLPKVVWDLIGRIQWLINSTKQPEQYTQSKKRVGNFIGRLIENREDVVLICHGWIIKLIIRELKKRGFKGPSPLVIANGIPYEYKLE